MCSPFKTIHTEVLPPFDDRKFFIFATFTLPEKMFISFRGKRKQWARFTEQEKKDYYYEFIKNDLKVSFDINYYSFEVHPNLGKNNIHCHCILVYDNLNGDTFKSLTDFIRDTYQAKTKIKASMLLEISNFQAIKDIFEYCNVINYIYKECPEHIKTYPPIIEEWLWGVRGANKKSPAGTSEADNINNYCPYLDNGLI